jgi:hypothetical protein
MVPRQSSEGSEPLIKVSAIGMANANGDYLQHDAVAPNKAHASVTDAITVIVRHESAPPGSSGSGGASDNAVSTALGYSARAPEVVTAITKAHVSANGIRLLRAVIFIEEHRVATLALVVGSLLFLIAGLLALR